MNFKLDFNFSRLQQEISISDSIFLMGSCFAENMYQKFELYKFDSICNPNGILFNPMSIANGLNSYLESTPDIDTLLFEHEGIWHSWWHHGSYIGSSREELKLKINEANKQAQIRLKNAQWLIITWGSAYVYELASNKLLVANCHKVPSGKFKKRLLSVAEITNVYSHLLEKLNRFNPGLKVMFSISPVRYTRDGLHENNLSKATLMLALQQLQNSNPKLEYFPAYEIVNDELRDYRFFEQDWVHPNKLAINYVWQRFTETCLTPETLNCLIAIEPIIQAKQHRPINEDSIAHKHFKSEFLKKTEALQKAYPYINLQEEIAFFGA
ncbi:MAG: GSCFA domain-containing protein [Bacteroidota bacterium]|nr:GSCFA domain-containing protein [Bacteroidota bacterium]